MTDPKDRLRQVLEQAMEDVALLMAADTEHRATQAEKLVEVRKSVATVWRMADLGDVPEWETRTTAQRVG